tara:strand:- start:755 stop:1615 length:861 start_codon:yes stop_codon:yes gene_type:complete
MITEIVTKVTRGQRRKSSNIKNRTWSRKDFENVKTPTWQRWVNQSNVKSLEEAVTEQGQLRAIIVCILPDGTKILTDGKHLYVAMKNIGRSTFNVMEVYVKDEAEAREMFISFNTKGKTLTCLDYVVSFGGSKLGSYRRFLSEVMQNPRNDLDARNVHSELFTVPSLINIFLGTNRVVKSGLSVLPKNYDRILDIVEYLGENYLTNGILVKQIQRNGKKMKLNGGSIIPVMKKIKSNKNILAMKNKEILDLLIEYTQYHYNSSTACSFSKDPVAETFPTFLQNKGI